MRMKTFFIPTQREEPQDAEIISHKLMLKAGLVRKMAAGIYSFLPLGLISIKKVENIVREEMNSIGALELLFPAILPKELWEETGRWYAYGEEIFRLKDRREREFCLGPTHEEAVVDLARSEIHSYKELPKTFYQIQTKYRDEIRPRFGLIRGREFIMKDAYSFHATEEELEKTYADVFNAYVRIFRRCGLTAIPIEADSGTIGGKISHEFVVKSRFGGESEFVICPQCGYAANTEVAKSADEPLKIDEDEKTLERVKTFDAKTIEEVSNFLNIRASKLVKSLLYKVDGNFVLVIVKGDDVLNEVKLRNLLSSGEIAPAGEEEVIRIMGAGFGAIGPVNTDVEIIMDKKVERMKNFVTGANENGYHYLNVNIGRDFKPAIIEDIRKVKDKDPCPHCRTPLEIYDGIEVGHTFKLGTKYSQKMNALFEDRDGKQKYYIMGCYGIGVGRTLQSIIEEHNDDFGIKWPFSIAPFHVEILPLNSSDEDIERCANSIYKKLLEHYVEVLLDDRDDISAGVKFNDADLIGIPLQVIIGNKYKSKGIVEVKSRETGQRVEINADQVIEFLRNYIEKELEKINK